MQKSSTIWIFWQIYTQLNGIIYNEENNIVPKTIVKEIRDVITNVDDSELNKTEKMSRKDKEKLMVRIENEMKKAAQELDFERATELRDILFEMKGNLDEL